MAIRDEDNDGDTGYSRLHSNPHLVAFAIVILVIIVVFVAILALCLIIGVVVGLGDDGAI